jgi:hypothetical protein
MALNNFQQLDDDRGSKLPSDLEMLLVHRAGGFAAVGGIVEHFVPNAVKVAGRMLSGDNALRPDPRGPGAHLSDDTPLWRIPQSGSYGPAAPDISNAPLWRVPPSKNR